jgi:hypothetical protein
MIGVRRLASLFTVFVLSGATHYGRQAPPLNVQPTPKLSSADRDYRSENHRERQVDTNRIVGGIKSSRAFVAAILYEQNGTIFSFVAPLFWATVGFSRPHTAKCRREIGPL